MFWVQVPRRRSHGHRMPHHVHEHWAHWWAHRRRPPTGPIHLRAIHGAAGPTTAIGLVSTTCPLSTLLQELLFTRAHGDQGISSWPMLEDQQARMEQVRRTFQRHESHPFLRTKTLSHWADEIDDAGSRGAASASGTPKQLVVFVVDQRQIEA